ncbi:O-acetylhomoserine aminocarboxypropyltransferase/cysteine synthase family protein [Bifidobacterium simiarum]|uniref:homocysteine desulfhydrase n=1 Tax=Bifidobacterium simiarum TaxID=2045441 RepID=A0A2M9HH46_9BIFI|nr:aminotransferase class I/II-fold pyridoxal phosphate-dependent enzyme [Bifidobacterium simiarum]MBT1165375.1 O-acetylhomoserine aminocarboxypropyltransferase/cysteine synthase [Bifidobacterium simiarum]PJM76119.1 O-acetylhomoserine aminocarboxypropyltransferase [Bifidobacterium simiarum]
MTTFDTNAVHGGYDRAANANAASVPIYATAAFDMESAVRGDRLAAGEEFGFSYSRVTNPTVDALERRLATLEGGEAAVATASGMAAVSFALLAAAEGGGRIIAPIDVYGATVDALATFFPQFGVHADFVDDINDLDEVEAAIRPETKVIFAESVANPSTRVTDLRPLADLAHRHGLPLIIDNTVPTPYLLRPIEFGADVVVHSTTKGICGHGNALGGMVIDAGRFDWSAGRHPQFTMIEQVISDERRGVPQSFASLFGNLAFIRRVRTKYVRTFGAVLSPFNAYQQLVGLETLPVRMEHEVASALKIARWLEGNPHVAEVRYSGLPGSPCHALAERYCPKGVGTILSFRLDGTEEHLRRLLDSTTVFTYLPNIGDARSLIVDPGRITHREVPGEFRRRAGITDQDVRLSIGLEDPDDLIADLGRAFAAAYGD